MCNLSEGVQSNTCLPVGVAASTTYVVGVQVQLVCLCVCVRSVCAVCTLRYFLAIFCCCFAACLTAHTHTVQLHIYTLFIYIYIYIFLLKDFAARRDRQTDKTDRNSHELCIMQRTSKKETFSISSTAFEGGRGWLGWAGEEGRDEWQEGRVGTACACPPSLLACNVCACRCCYKLI